MRYARCVVCNETVGWVGLISSLALSGLKLFVGLVSGSHALLADSLYSAKDVVTSLLIIVGLKVSRHPIDQEHPFGHGKVEFLLGLAISLVLMGFTGMLLYFAAGTLWEGAHAAPHMIALWTALLSLGVNVFLNRYTHCVAEEINSPMVHTLSRHYHSDSFSSLAVVLAIIGSHSLGMPWLDTVVAIGEALHLLYLGGVVLVDSFHGLMDSSAPAATLEHIRQETLDVRGVARVEELRTRRVGQDLWISVVVGVDPELSVQQAKGVAQRVEDVLSHRIPHVGDVGVHFRSRGGSVPELDAIRPEIAELTARQLQREVRS
ncbi:MAG: magnetosome biogenesis CDF transporter MamM [Magnetococcales bacterium]|nr:magnetosome biogenesis CDF transporter MamM [Magnetococcales bacterium]